jgi:hypothetical protein
MILDERLENHPYTHGLLHLIQHAPAPPYVPRLAWQPLRPLAGQVLWVLTVGCCRAGPARSSASAGR